MKVTKILPPPVVTPPARVVVELTEEEALALKQLVGSIEGSERDLRLFGAKFTHPDPRGLLFDALYERLDHPQTQTLDVPNAEERRLFFSGLKIDAIKCYRARTGSGLKEAKDIIEAIR